MLEEIFKPFEKPLRRYARRYIRTGSPAPLFHVIGGVMITGIFLHAKAHHDRVHYDPYYKAEDH